MLKKQAGKKGVAVDPIANMLTIIRNGLLLKKETVDVPSSKLKLEIAKILQKEGFVGSYKAVDARQFQIQLKYKGKEPSINSIIRVSKPGRRIYVKHNAIPRVLGGLGIIIISTPSGIMTGSEAKKKCLGGEIIAKVW